MSARESDAMAARRARQELEDGLDALTSQLRALQVWHYVSYFWLGQLRHVFLVSLCCLPSRCLEFRIAFVMSLHGINVWV